MPLWQWEKIQEVLWSIGGKMEKEYLELTRELKEKLLEARDYL